MGFPGGNEEMVIRPGRHPGLSQRLPTNQRTPEGDESLVDIRPFVVADAEAAELIQPSKRTLDDPAPPPQGTLVRGAAHRQQGHDTPHSETPPNGGCVVTAIREYTVRTKPRSTTSPRSGGIASTNARASCESLRFAQVRRTASTPRPSQIR
jgi:hypothetical protein